MFGYAPEIIASFPAVRAGIIHATGLVNAPSPPELVAEYRRAQEAAVAMLAETPIAQLPSIAAWRRAFSQFGVKPTQHRVAAEALLRRLDKQGDIPSINTLVDIGTLVSNRYAVPVAVFDQAEIAGPTVVRFAAGHEVFTDLGASENVSPAAGEVIFVDTHDVVSARRWCWRQSAQSATKPSTTEALFVTEAHHDGAAADIAAARDDLADLLARFQPDARQELDALSAARPAME